MPPSPPLLLLFLTHTHGNSSCRWFYSHIWQQLELWAHLFHPRWRQSGILLLSYWPSFTYIHFSIHCSNTTAKILHQRGSRTFPLFRRSSLLHSPKGNKCLLKSHTLHSHTHCFLLFVFFLLWLRWFFFLLFFYFSHFCPPHFFPFLFIFLPHFNNMSTYYQSGWWLVINCVEHVQLDVCGRHKIISKAARVCGHFVTAVWWHLAIGG